MGRIVHFEIHVNDMERAKAFYGEVFGWSFQDWSDYAGMPYFGAVTGNENEHGIDGALMQRQSAPPETGQALNAFACTIGVENYDLTEAKIIENGGKLAMPKFALPGMAWQGYYIDPEGNTFGIHQPDVNAK
ncbi:VOC family protein [Peribacillus frigoritolerans]|jgi:predicted enzyme related to lactoylglutathione lyase|uniref:VOC family protein n=1 Tax=Peribacillus frigoritolerans TaxID=450367 RepID=UPI000BFCADC8|nr:VOC family protein [Peribacillus frigoritolerans]MBD8138624.1 VOC family protein [Bacillus sp. CFBP 13597]PHD76309.1 glyoxalase [Bacillus sp. AFS043905]QNK49190.1 VOC family protein [Brevibacterium sp. PAMC23299]MED4696767.1 VOC family protein [Peribacillus frigoritolerans]WHX66622.1 VOC family protein [Peribacillus frigoritolerans]